MVIALLMVPFLLAYLGKDGYGLIGLLGVIVGISNIADLGLRGALGRELTEAVARQQSERFRQLATTALGLYLAVGVLLAVATWVLAPWFVTVFRIPERLAIEALWLIRWFGGASLILAFLTPVYSAGVTAHHRFDVVNAIQTSLGITSSLVLFLVIGLAGNPLYAWAIVTLVSQAAIGVATRLAFRRLCPDARWRRSDFRVGHLGSLVKLGGAMYAVQMTTLLSEKADPVVISMFHGPAGVALYQPGARLSAVLKPVVLTLANQMHPLTTKHFVANQVAEMQKILVLGTKYTLLMGVLFSATILYFAEPLARLWLEKSIGDDYHSVATIMQGTALVDLMVFAAGTQWSVLLGMKRLRFLVWTLVPTAILNIAVSVYLVGYTSVGIPGVLVATILIGLIRRPILIWHTATVCQLSPWHYLRSAYLPPLLCFLMTLAGAVAASRIWSPDHVAGLLLCGGATVGTWALSCWFLGLQANERGVVANLGRKFLRARAAS